MPRISLGSVPHGAALLVLLLGCGESSGPGSGGSPRPPVPVSLGDTVLADLRNDSLLTYTVQGSAGAEFVVFAQNESGVALVDVWDSATPTVILQRIAPGTDPVPGHLTRHRTERLTITASQTLTVGLRRSTGRGRTRFWLYPVNRAPETADPALALGATLTGEDLENSADVDEFTIPLASPAELIAYGRRLQAGGPGASFLSLHTPDGTQLDQPLHLGETADLQIGHSGRVLVAQAGIHTVRIEAIDLDADSAGAAPLRYEFQLHGVNRAPETVPATVAAGDTVEGEGIDYIGDVDEYSVVVQAGDEYNLFLQSAGSPAGLALTGWPVNAVSPVFSLPGDSALAIRSTGRFTVAMTGTLTIRVEGLAINNLRGPYRLFLYRINRAPELAPPTFSIGQTIAETIEYPGDVDEFTAVASVEDSAQLRLLDPPGPGWLSMRWGPPGQLGDPCPGAVNAADTVCSTGIVPAVTPGLVIQVLEPDGPTPSYRGGYNIVTTGITAAPEVGPDVVSVGDTLTGAIDVEADLDDFRFANRYADPLDLRVISQGPGPLATAMVEDGGLSYYTSGEYSTGRFTLSASGTFRIRVAGPPGAVYAFALTPVATTPETVPAAVTVADSITGEAFDSLGDIDEFVLSAPPGTEVQAFLSSTASGIGFLTLQTWFIGDTAPRSALLVQNAGRRFTMPASGQARIRALETRGGGVTLTDAYHRVGPYSLWFRTQDPAPETVSPALTLGIPITDELIDHPGDLDDFTFACSSGQIITGMITGGIPNNFSFEDPVAVQLLDPATGEVLASASTTDSDTETTGPVTLTAGGACRARVTTIQTTNGHGGYTLLVE